MTPKFNYGSFGIRAPATSAPDSTPTPRVGTGQLSLREAGGIMTPSREDGIQLRQSSLQQPRRSTASLEIDG